MQSYLAVKEDTETDQAEELKGNFSVSNLGTYRVKIVINHPKGDINNGEQFQVLQYTHKTAGICLSHRMRPHYVS